MQANTRLSQFYYPLLLLCAFSIPFNNFLIQLFGFSLTLLWLMERAYLTSWKNIFKNPLLLVVVLFFLFHLAGLLYSENLAEGKFNIEKKMSFLLLPLILGTSGQFDVKARINKILLSFSAGCFIVALVCISIGIYRYVLSGNSGFLLYHELVSPFGLHAVYFGMYLCFSVFFLFNIFFIQSNEFGRIYKSAVLLLVVFFTGIIVLLSARTVLLAYVFVFFILTLIYFFRKRQMLIGTGILLVSLALVFFAVRQIPFFADRINDIINSKLYFSPEENNANGLTLRIVKWTCSINGIVENPFTGVGTGDAQDYLQQCYKEKNFWGQVFEFNSHNQYLQTGLSLGFPGLITLLLIFFFSFRAGIRAGEISYLAVMTVFFICFLTESMLERQQGIIPFCFFTFLFYRKTIEKVV